MNILPNASNAIIPLKKLTSYSLSFEKDPNKAEAFRISLRYTLKNAEKLVNNIL